MAEMAAERLTMVEPHKNRSELEVVAEREQQLERVEEPVIDFELVRDTLEQQVDQLSRSFRVKHRRLLRWADKRGYTFDFLVTSGAKVAATGGLMASLLMSTPQTIAGIRPQNPEVQQQQQLEAAVSARKRYQLTVQATAQKHQEEQQQLTQSLHQMAQSPGAFGETQANQAATMVSQLTGVTAVTDLEGYQLNTTLGRIGGEQHLKRYPGESIGEHFATATDRQVFESSGYAPGLGAYGYFAPSKAALTDEAVQQERYYVAVQTFASPNWSHNVQATYNWFRYRKVLVYNPQTGQAVVADVADAGPALSTGKSFGGSPEVMTALQAHDGLGSAPVMMFFVDDSANQVPLGPVHYQVERAE